jgi:2-methylcitrate dehydratase PrpD
VRRDEKTFNAPNISCDFRDNEEQTTMKRQDKMSRRSILKSTLAVGAAIAATRAKAFASNSNQHATTAFPDTKGLTQYVVDFVLKTRFEAIPADVLAIGKKSILDGFGLALAGSVAQSGPISRQYVQSLGICEAKATLIGTGLKSAPRFAAFVNGISMHADDFDDTQLAIAPDRVYGLLTHPTSPLLPAIFATAETMSITGKQLLAAYHVGVEVETKIAEAISPRHYGDGFHSTGTCGSFASTSGCAKLRGLTDEQTLYAFGIVGAEAAGLRENFGTMTKPFQAGHAAENGVAATDLAKLGWTAAPQILEAGRGFFHAYGGSYDPAAIMNKLGNPWTFVTPGVSIKPYPSGSLTHPAMTAALRLIQKYDIKPDQIEKIDVGTNHNMPNALIHHQPKTGLQGKFSMEFCIAVLALTRKATLVQFTDAYVNRPDVQEMIKKVNFYVDPVAEQAGFDKMTSLVTIHLKDGRTLKDQADFAKGSPAIPMTFDEVAEKFQGCADFANWPKAKAETVVQFVATLENQPDCRKLTAALTSSAA